MKSTTRLSWCLAILLGAGALGGEARAAHENVPFLSDGTPLQAGVCTFYEEDMTYRFVCQMYQKPDGRYVALYLDEEIVVVRRMNKDGTIGESVWSREETSVEEDVNPPAPPPSL